MVRSMLSVCLLMAVLAFGAAGSAQVPSNPTPAGAPQEPKTRQEQAPPDSVTDEVFVAQVLRQSRAEIERSKMALSKSVRPDVKIFAQRLVDDHTKINGELATIASGRKMILPEDPAQDKATLDQLDKLTGEAFDRTYLTQVIAGHVRLLDAFKEYGEKATDAVLKGWAAKTLPMLQQHLDLAREVEKKLQS